MQSFIAYIILFIFVLAAPAFSNVGGNISDITEIGVGARPLGMGKAFTAADGDANSILFNPAGISSADTFRFASMRTTILSDINYTMIAAAAPFKFGVLGLGFVNSSITSIPLTRWTGSGASQRPEQYSSADYSNTVIILDFAPNLPNKISKKLNIGVSAKYYAQGFSGGGVSLEGAAGSGIDLDIGLIIKPSSWQKFGLSISNILPSNLGGVFKWSKNGIEESIPSIAKVGCALKLLGPDGFRNYQDQELNFVFDEEFNIGRAIPALFHTGIEWFPIEYLAVRGGIDQKANAGSSGTNISSNLTLGLGIKYENFTFDYAYYRLGELSDNTTHFFSIGFAAPR